MAKNENYTGNIEMIDGFIPANGNDFPLMDAHHVITEDGTRLDVKLNNMGGGGGSNIALDTTLTLVGKAAEAYATGEAIGKVGKKVDDIDEVITGMASGGTGYVRYIQTFEGDRIVKLFIGTQQEYEYLTSEEKEDLLAIITDTIENEEQSKPQTYSKTFSDTVVGAPYTDFNIGELPQGKTVEDIVDIKISGAFDLEKFGPHEEPYYSYVHLNVSNPYGSYDNGSVLQTEFSLNFFNHIHAEIYLKNAVALTSAIVELKAWEGNIYMNFSHLNHTVIGENDVSSLTLSDGAFKLLGVEYTIA